MTMAQAFYWEEGPEWVTSVESMDVDDAVLRLDDRAALRDLGKAVASRYRGGSLRGARVILDAPAASEIRAKAIYYAVVEILTHESHGREARRAARELEIKAQTSEDAMTRAELSDLRRARDTVSRLESEGRGLIGEPAGPLAKHAYVLRMAFGDWVRNDLDLMPVASRLGVSAREAHALVQNAIRVMPARISSPDGVIDNVSQSERNLLLHAAMLALKQAGLKRQPTPDEVREMEAMSGPILLHVYAAKDGARDPEAKKMARAERDAKAVQQKENRERGAYMHWAGRGAAKGGLETGEQRAMRRLADKWMLRTPPDIAFGHEIRKTDIPDVAGESIYPAIRRGIAEARGIIERMRRPR
jgi:hypothetical protein